MQRELESRMTSERREHTERTGVLEADNRELAAAKYRHEATIRELRAKLAAVCNPPDMRVAYDCRATRGACCG